MRSANGDGAFGGPPRDWRYRVTEYLPDIGCDRFGRWRSSARPVVQQPRTHRSEGKGGDDHGTNHIRKTGSGAVLVQNETREEEDGNSSDQ